MPITPADVAVLATIARYYVLTREQVQRLCFPSHRSGRSVRKRLGKLRRAGYITRHRMPVVLPGTNGAAPVYYPTKAGAQLLASYFDDESYRATNTRAPRADRLPHWIAINETRMVIEAAVAAQSEVVLDRFINEWETVNRDAAVKQQFFLHTQLRNRPPLSCSPDGAFLLSLRGHSKVFYLEQDLGTSSPRQIAARKTKGYAELARRQGHRKHFPDTTFSDFSILFVTTSAHRCQATAQAIRKMPGSNLWLFIPQQDLTAEAFLHEPVILDCEGNCSALVKQTPQQASPAGQEQPT